MKLTETRKAIIELIEPYLNKTIDRGCLIKYGDGYAYVYNVISNGKKTIVMTHGVGDMSLDDIEFDDDYQIVGHYEITGISRFASEDGVHLEIYSGKIVFALRDKYGELADELGEIPNTPLHLYSEEQDKQLLEILQGL